MNVKRYRPAAWSEPHLLNRVFIEMPYICRRQVHFPNLPWTAARGSARDPWRCPRPLQPTAERQAVNSPAPALRIEACRVLKEW